MSFFSRFPKSDPVIWKRIALSYLIALPMLFILFRSRPQHPSLVMELLGFLMVIVVSRILARLILRSNR